MFSRSKVTALVSELLARLRSRPLHTMTFVLIGVVVAVLLDSPAAIARIESGGWAAFLQRWPRQVLSFFVVSLFIAVALRAATGRGSNLAQGPAKFLLVITIGTTLAALLGIWSRIGIDEGSRHLALSDLPLAIYFDAWLQTTVWSGLIGWLYLLSLQHAEDRDRLTSMLGKRALLARQLAHSQLGAARAQIEPAMVAGILSEVHCRYRGDPPGAAVLLDHLINYLRMALNRGGKTYPSFDSELALLRNSLDRELKQGTSSDMDKQAGARTS